MQELLSLRTLLSTLLFRYIRTKPLRKAVLGTNFNCTKPSEFVTPKPQKVTPVLPTPPNAIPSTEPAQSKRPKKKKRSKKNVSSQVFQVIAKEEAQGSESDEEEEESLSSETPDINLNVSLPAPSSNMLLTANTTQVSPPSQEDTAEEEVDEEERSQYTIDMLDDMPWEVALSPKAASHFDSYPPKIKKAILNKLLFLAEGNRSSRSAKRLEGADHPLVLFESYLPDGIRMVSKSLKGISMETMHWIMHCLHRNHFRSNDQPHVLMNWLLCAIWQIEIEFSERVKSYTDIIRVWDIVRHDKVSSMVHYLNDRMRVVDENCKYLRHNLKMSAMQEVHAKDSLLV